jgi:hypothetical protein
VCSLFAVNIVVFRELNDGSLAYEREYSGDDTCTPADQTDPSSICRLVVHFSGTFANTRMLYIMVSTTAAVNTGDIRLTIAPVSSKTNCPPLDGVQGVVFQGASSDDQYVTCLYPFGTGTRSQAVTKCDSIGATLPWTRGRYLGEPAVPHRHAQSLIARIVGMTDSTTQVWMLGSRPCTPAEPCDGYTGGWTGTDARGATLQCEDNEQGCIPWLWDQPSTYVHS